MTHRVPRRIGASHSAFISTSSNDATFAEVHRSHQRIELAVAVPKHGRPTSDLAVEDAHHARGLAL